MSSQLPLLPSIDHLRYQAKDLLELCQAGNIGAMRQLCETCPEFRVLSHYEIASTVRLHHAQDVIARNYGFQKWSHLSESVELARRSASALSTAMDDRKMEDFEYRAGIARSKGLPEVGTVAVSEYGLPYEVVDYVPAISVARAARVRAGGPAVHINDLLPVIAFPEMSDRLREIYIETDCATTRPIVMFDTMPNMHPSAAAPDQHQVLTLSIDAPIFIHLDAARLHETILAHELGHIWVEQVDQVEDYRHPKDQSNLPRALRFYHIQSFVMDLLVNDLLERRGFDMSIIARHQAESISNIAANCARGERPKNRRVLASVINAIAGALLEMERFPAGWAAGVKDSLEMIRIGLPEAFEPAKGFVRSVLRHGYADSPAVMRVVDECTKLSFAATGDSFDPGADLTEVARPEPGWDKRPGFLSCLPLSSKQEVFRNAAKHGITGGARYDVLVHGSGDAYVSIGDPHGEIAQPLRLCFRLPHVPDTVAHGASDFGSYNGPQDPNSCFFPPAPIDRFQGLPENVRAMMQPNFGQQPHAGHAPPGYNDMNGWEDPRDFIRAWTNHMQSPGPSVPQTARIQRQNEEIQRQLAERHNRIRMQNELLTRVRQESYDGTELTPCLILAGKDHARLNQQQPHDAIESGRSYMAGVGLFISRVGFEQQMAGESAYGYCMNNPLTYFDPDGEAPATWGWNNWWIKKSQKLLHDCIAAGQRDGNCSGLDTDKVSKMMRCIIGCEVDNLPGPGAKGHPRDYPGYDVMQPDPGYPHGGVGPCRLTGGAQWGGFKYPNTNWRNDPCDNIEAGIALLCFDIKNRNVPPNSYKLPGDWKGDKNCYDRCMAFVPKKGTNGKRKKRTPK